MSLYNNINNYLIPQHEKVDFMKNFAVMAEGGVAINETLNMLALGTASPQLRVVIEQMKKQVDQGATLTEVFRANEAIFGSISTSVLSAGELSGTLDKSLLFLAEYLEYSYDLSQEVSAALIYPKFIGALILVSTAFLTGFILPKLVPIFAQLHTALPLSTRLLLALSTFVRGHWLLLSVVIAISILIWMFIKRFLVVKTFLDKIALRLPLLGQLITNYQLALFTQLFLTLFKSGSPVNEALVVAGSGATNIGYQRAIERIRLLVEHGMKFSDAITRERNYFPNNIIAMVSAGEQSGSLEKSFSSLSEYYSKEVRLRTKKLPSLIEPILLVIIAGVVGFVALSIVLPIYEVTRGITH